MIDQISEKSHSNRDFIYEVWYTVSQLTVYDRDVNIRSEGRYALDTLTRTGGDCEDLVILIADMLMSSKYTKQWEFHYRYMDSKNPTDLQAMNHVILVVNDGKQKYYIEATAPPNFGYFSNGVAGWDYPANQSVNHLLKDIILSLIFSCSHEHCILKSLFETFLYYKEPNRFI